MIILLIHIIIIIIIIIPISNKSPPGQDRDYRLDPSSSAVILSLSPVTEFSPSLSFSPVTQFSPFSLSFYIGSKQPRIGSEVLGHSLVRSLIRSHCSLIRLIRAACFARALCSAHLFTRSLTHSQARGKVND